MPADTRFTTGVITHKHCWHESLFSLTVRSTIKPFVAGQFTSLAANINDTHTARAYSIASAPHQNDLEFYFNRVIDGPLSNHLASLEAGDTIEVAKSAAGFFTLEEVLGGKDLWMMATGTGLGPYISILRSPEVWQRFDNIIVVHAARTEADLGYRTELLTIAKQNSTFQYIPIVTREKMKTTLSQRFPLIISNDTLAAETGCDFKPESSRIMLCGSMDMIKDTTVALNDLGITKHLRSRHGQIISEKYW